MAGLFVRFSVPFPTDVQVNMLPLWTVSHVYMDNQAPVLYDFDTFSRSHFYFSSGMKIDRDWSISEYKNSCVTEQLQKLRQVQARM